jgi:hypothetical protein
MVRRFRPWLIIVAVATLGVARGANVSVDVVIVRGLPCHACSQGVSLNTSGSVASASPFEGESEPLTAEEQAKVHALIADLPFDALQKADGMSLPANAAGVVSVEVFFSDGSHMAASVARSARGSDNVQLSAWIRSVNELADGTLFRTRIARLRTALASRAVRSIELETLPGYGPRGRGYRVRFTDADVATITGACDSTAPIAFARVLDASQLVPWLLPHYTTNTIDASGARITITTADGSSFVSEGAASRDWDDFFRVTEIRLDQIVRDAVWVPSIDGAACRRMVGSH